MNAVTGCEHDRSEWCDCPDRLVSIDCGCGPCRSAHITRNIPQRRTTVRQWEIPHLTPEERARLCHTTERTSK